MDLLDESVELIHRQATTYHRAGLTETASVHRSIVETINALSDEEIDIILKMLEEKKYIKVSHGRVIPGFYHFKNGCATLTEAVLGFKRYLIYSSIHTLIGRLVQ